MIGTNMGKVVDIKGQKFGRLLVIEQDFEYPINHNIKGHKAYWKCKCDCGKEVVVRGQSLRNGNTISCGCYNQEKKSYQTTPNMIGERYGKLTVLKRVGSKNNCSLWRCKCDCGNEIDVIRDSLITGNTKSCGCIISNGENIIKDIFKANNIPYKSQYSFPDLVGLKNTRLRFDFGVFDRNSNLLCLIEFQGEQHFIPFKNDTEETFNRRLKYDQLKREYCQTHNIKLIEINYKDRFRLNWEYFQNLFIQENININ